MIGWAEAVRGRVAAALALDGLDGPQAVRRIAAISIAVAVSVLVLKLAAWRMTGSVALYSDAAESLVNVAAALAAFIAIRVADRPADRNHPFGHHKAEYLSAVLEGALIIVASLSVLYSAWHAFAAPQPLEAPLEGLLTNTLAGVLNGVWGAFIIAEGRRRSSPALVADGWHLMSDVASSAGVLAGLLIVLATGFLVLDALIAAAVGFYILFAGWRLFGDSVGGLMDEAPAPELIARIRAVIGEHQGDAIEVHDVRTRRAGRAVFIEFHLVVHGDMSVSRSHAICDRIEAALRAQVPGAITTIHVEPHDKAKGRRR